jgi:hypothetical protein
MTGGALHSGIHESIRDSFMILHIQPVCVVHDSGRIGDSVQTHPTLLCLRPHTVGVASSGQNIGGSSATGEHACAVLFFSLRHPALFVVSERSDMVSGLP